mmetsp:Transcript_1401/g.5657  ORF Transcript_1401/g.5657 Transcript_1401/m.5657 type:complete len:91 (-) Transcript_1401:370-642(-)
MLTGVRSVCCGLGLAPDSYRRGLDLYKEGTKVGRLYLSFETKSMPTAQSTSRSSLCCCAPCRMDDDEIAVIGDRASATPCLLNKEFLATT